MTYIFILKCASKLVEEIILYYDARSKKHQIVKPSLLLLHVPACIQSSDKCIANITITLVQRSLVKNVLLKSLFEVLVSVKLLKPTGYVMHHQFNIQQLYALPTLYLCVLYLSENKQ